MDGYKIQHKNVNLKVNISVPNLRLFIGNIPKIMSKEQIFNEFNKITGNLIVLTVVDDDVLIIFYMLHRGSSRGDHLQPTGRS